MNGFIRTGMVLGTACALLVATQVMGDEAQANQEQVQVQNQDQGQKGDVKTPVINNVQKRQVAKIRNGVKSGELTAGEARELAQNQKEIQEMKREAKADGKMTKQEKKQILKEQKKQKKEIRKKKNNGKKRK